MHTIKIKPLAIVLFMFIVIVAIVFVYLGFAQKSKPITIRQTDNLSKNDLLDTKLERQNETNKSKLVFDINHLSPIIDENGQIIYYSNQGQRAIGIYRFNPSSKTDDIISDELLPAKDAIWSSDKKTILIKAEFVRSFFDYYSPKIRTLTQNLNANQIYWWIYNIDNKKLSIVGKNIDNCIWFSEKIIDCQLLNSINNQNMIVEINTKSKTTSPLLNFNSNQNNSIQFYHYQDNIIYANNPSESEIPNPLVKYNISTKETDPIDSSENVIYLKPSQSNNYLIFSGNNNELKYFNITSNHTSTKTGLSVSPRQAQIINHKLIALNNQEDGLYLNIINLDSNQIIKKLNISDPITDNQKHTINLDFIGSNSLLYSIDQALYVYSW